MSDPPKPGSKRDYKLIAEPGRFELTVYKPTIVHGTDGYVALLDVLGFRGMVGAESQEKTILTYLQTIERVLIQSPVETIVFSDSVVLTKSGGSADDLHQLVVRCSELMGALLETNIAIRGAISYGKFVRSQIKGSVFLAGRPIVEAYEYEQRQDWVGVILTPSTLQKAAEIAFAATCTTALPGDDAFQQIEDILKWKAYLQRAAIPFKGGASHDGFAVVPNGKPSLPELAVNLSKMLERLEWLKLLAPSPAEQIKYANTLSWLRSIHNIWCNRSAEYEQWQKKN